MRSICLVSLFLFASCAMQMDLPEGFLRLTDVETGDLRAVTGEDARIWARDFDVGYEADLEFWWDALLVDLCGNRGHTVQEVGAVEDGSGHAGRLLEGEVVVQGQRCGYLLAVMPVGRSWLGRHRLRTFEFLAPREIFTERKADVLAALSSLR